MSNYLSIFWAIYMHSLYTQVKHYMYMMLILFFKNHVLCIGKTVYSRSNNFEV